MLMQPDLSALMQKIFLIKTCFTNLLIILGVQKSSEL